MADEKYISIEYGKWNSYYKPLEEKYNELQEEFLREKENKKVTIYLEFHSHLVNSFKTREIGGLDLTAGRINFNKDNIYNLAEQAIIDIKNDGLYRGISFMNISELGQSLKNIDNSYQKLLKKEIAIEMKKNSIPRIIRWLFKIK